MSPRRLEDNLSIRQVPGTEYTWYIASVQRHRYQPAADGPEAGYHLWYVYQGSTACSDPTRAELMAQPAQPALKFEII